MKTQKHISGLQQLLIFGYVVLFFGCKSFTPVAISDRNPIASADAMRADSITVTIEIMGEYERGYTFDNQFQPEHTVAVSRLCVANKSSVPVTFRLANVPNYLSPEDAYRRSRANPLTSVGTGLVAGLITPIIMVLADTSDYSNRYLSERGFTISLSVGALIGLGGAFHQASENSQRWAHIWSQSIDKYTIPADGVLCMAVFFDTSISPLIPYLAGSGYALSDSAGISLKKGTDPVMFFENEDTGQGVIFPMILR